MSTSSFDRRILDAFPSFVVRKDLSKRVKGNALVPTYVLEYLLGQYCSTDDESTIDDGVQRVLDILRDHYVNRSEAGLVRSRIKERGRYRVIDRVEAELNDKRGAYEASFMNLGIKKVEISSDIVKRHPKLLIGGVWCIVDVQYQLEEGASTGPWYVDTLKPIQVANFRFEDYLAGREHFSVDDWIDVLVQSMGFDPQFFGERDKLFLISRLIPYCENNFNFIELGPKGTGKSHIFSEFSPHGILISGGEVTLAKLFVNNSNGRLGLVGYWDTVAFDEFAGKTKRVDKSLVDVMKNYLANKSFSRGMDTQGASASFAFVGNTRRSVPYMLKHSDLFEELPPAYHDSAFIDRLHFYLPGWEVPVIRNELFSEGYGFIVDYFAEALRHLRNLDYSQEYTKYFELNRGLSERDRTSVQKTLAGLLKILYPGRDADRDAVEKLLAFSMEARKRVYDQLIRIDETFERREFYYRAIDESDSEKGAPCHVSTLEERQYPGLRGDGLSHHEEEDPAAEQETPESSAAGGAGAAIAGSTAGAAGAAGAVGAAPPSIEPGSHILIEENQTGVSFKRLFGPCLAGAAHVEICDPYIRNFHQVKNLHELLQVIMELKELTEEVEVHLITREADGHDMEQEDLLRQVAESFAAAGVQLTYEIKNDPSLHARYIQTDTGWKISLDRGLDIFQAFNRRDAFDLQSTLQEQRRCRAFEVTYLRVDAG